MIQVTTRADFNWPESSNEATIKPSETPMTDLEKQLNDMPEGQHFWGILQGKLCVMMCHQDGNIYVCGGWEVRVWPEKVVSLIDLPEGYSEPDLLYIA